MRCDEADRDRQVEVAAFLAQVGGGEMNDDGAMVELDSRVADGAAHALLALAHRGVAEADQVGLRHAPPHVDLDRDQLGVDAPGGGAEDGGQHGGEGREFGGLPCTLRGPSFDSPCPVGLLHCPIVPAGYSRRRLVEKLDMKPGTKAHLRGAPSGYLDLLGPLPDGRHRPLDAANAGRLHPSLLRFRAAAGARPSRAARRARSRAERSGSRGPRRRRVSPPTSQRT